MYLQHNELMAMEIHRQRLHEAAHRATQARLRADLGRPAATAGARRDAERAYSAPTLRLPGLLALLRALRLRPAMA